MRCFSLVSKLSPFVLPPLSSLFVLMSDMSNKEYSETQFELPKEENQ